MTASPVTGWAMTPLRVLEGRVLPAYIEPEELATLGDFAILDGWVRDALDKGRQSRDVVFVVMPLAGAQAGVVHYLSLVYSPARRKVVEELRLQATPLGPCALVIHRVDEHHTLWGFAGREPDGSLWVLLHGIPLLDSANDISMFNPT